MRLRQSMIMMKHSDVAEGHGRIVFVAGGDNFIVAIRSARLNDPAHFAIFCASESKTMSIDYPADRR
jgi:hypothetical protein